MGFRPPKRVQTVTIPEGSDWYGLVVELKPMDFGVWLKLTNDGAGGLSMRDVINSVETMSHQVISWNLEDIDTGEPVPTDSASVMQQDSIMLTAIATEWLSMATGVSDPLPQTSGDTAPLPEVFLPTEDLFPLPESSDGPA